MGKIISFDSALCWLCPLVEKHGLAIIALSLASQFSDPSNEVVSLGPWEQEIYKLWDRKLKRCIVGNLRTEQIFLATKSLGTKLSCGLRMVSILCSLVFIEKQLMHMMFGRDSLQFSNYYQAVFASGAWGAGLDGKFPVNFIYCGMLSQEVRALDWTGLD
ncbi:hypothetical protein PoB_003186700 [Plakobranchus ocellatus]|uniref:Uncharacterized protein n=1 Tax=Plakobranchus ocellatus TaxID=259542 RepID=A0AAV4ADM5_9GAST|nr:hypothetical protein PoB_003186700 [Plakobranchus ocellatus]